MGEDTTSHVVTEVRGIADGKGIGSLNGDLARFAAVELSHSLNFGERDEVAIFQTMPRLIEAGD